MSERYAQLPCASKQEVFIELFLIFNCFRVVVSQYGMTIIIAEKRLNVEGTLPIQEPAGPPSTETDQPLFHNPQDVKVEPVDVKEEPIDYVEDVKQEDGEEPLADVSCTSIFLHIITTKMSETWL